MGDIGGIGDTSIIGVMGGTGIMSIGERRGGARLYGGERVGGKGQGAGNTALAEGPERECVAEQATEARMGRMQGVQTLAAPM